MKNIKILIIISLLIYIIIYLLHSFVFLEINFTKWSESARVRYVMLTSIFNIFSGFLNFAINDLKN